jgi:hypothetical protein
LDIAEKTISSHVIRVYPSECSENFSKEDYNPFMSPKMTDDNTLYLSMPWGDEKLIFPLDDIIVFNLP